MPTDVTRLVRWIESHDGARVVGTRADGSLLITVTYTKDGKAFETVEPCRPTLAAARDFLGY